VELVRKDGSVAQSYGDKRGYSWPPFETGNQAALKEGWRSQRAIDDLTIEVAEELLEQSPHAARWPTALLEAAGQIALARLSRAAAFRQLRADPDKVPSRAVESATGAANSARGYLHDLGIGNQAFARLQLIAGHAQVTEHTLADVVARGRATPARQAQLEADAVDTEETDVDDGD